MLRWSHHLDIFETLHFIVRCLADRSEGPLPPCSCRRRRCSCTPPASASSPTSAKDIESRPSHVNSWSPAICQWGNIHTYIHTYIIIIMVLSNLSVSDVSIYFVWLTALLVMRDELEHLYIHTSSSSSCVRIISSLPIGLHVVASSSINIHTYIHTSSSWA